MAIEFLLPPLGEGIETGDVVSVLVAAGDTIAVDEPVVEIETDKATIEVPSPVAGRVERVAVAAGETIAIGQLILTLDGSAPGVAPTATQANAPDLTVAPASRSDLQTASQTPPSLPPEQVESAPASHEDAGPVPAATGVGPRKDTDVGRALPTTGRAAATPAGVGALPSPTEVDPAAVLPRMEHASKVDLQRARVLAAPSIRRLAREFGVDIGEVSGSGTRGRVTADDVKAHARRILTRARQATATPVESEPDLPDFSQWGVVERTRMSSVRRATARQMSRAWQAVPHVTQHDRADVTEFEAVRKKLKTRRPSLPLSVTAYTVKVLGAALETFPQFNASFDVGREEVIYKKYINVGIAVDTDRGLLVPIVRDVGAKSLSEISLEIASVAEKARARTITLEELQGGTFTVTNLGGLGGTLFTPIINHPEVAILGLSRSTFEPVLTGGISASFQPRLMMPLSLSYDHRVIDGADAVRFLRWVAERIEHPLLLDLP